MRGLVFRDTEPRQDSKFVSNACFFLRKDFDALAARELSNPPLDAAAVNPERPWLF